MSAEAWFFAASVPLAYLAGIRLVSHPRLRKVPPLIPALALLILLLVGLQIPHERFMAGGQVIDVWLAPATVALGLALYRQRQTLIRNLKAVLLASFAGTLTALVSTFLLVRLTGLDWPLTAALLTKSVTTPVALALAPGLGASAPLAVAMVIIAGNLGGAFGLQLLSLGRVKTPLARGLAMGTAAHALGTATVMQEGETAGALGSVALILAALFTALLLPPLMQIF